MNAVNAATLLINALTLPLAGAFLVIILWSDARKELNQFFAAFLLLVILWCGGSLAAQMLLFVDAPTPLINLAVGVLELGFTGSSVAIYTLTAALLRVLSRRFRVLAFTALLVILITRLVVTFGGASSIISRVSRDYSYQSQPFLIAFYLVFGFGTLYLLWRYRRKLRSAMMRTGIVLFVIAQSLGLLNPELDAASLAVNLGALAALLISFALVQQEIIRPLAARNSQVEAIRRVNLAITSQEALEPLLAQVADQAAALLEADGVGIFLKAAARADNSPLRLAYAHELPRIGNDHLALSDGISARVTDQRTAVLLDDYAREWSGSDDIPRARQTFGSVIGAPLIHGDEVVGALLVVAGRRFGRLFTREDVYLLELLGAQAAVAIVHHRLFEEQAELTRAVELARSQLETVLDSTNNLVLAVDRRFRLIFANPAAREALTVQDAVPNGEISHLLAKIQPPDSLLSIMRHLREHHAYTYDVTLGEKSYICSVTGLGQSRALGLVAVLNDVTQLKELDRLKSEMVRMTSHDLKNPLQAAMLHTELLREDVEALADNSLTETVHVIEKQLARMNRIISGILDLEKVRSGKLLLELTTPARIVHYAVDELRVHAHDAHISLSVDVAEDLPEFLCDVEQFQRALANLIENAIKFTPAGGSVSVRAHHSPPDLLFEVRDTGVGIDEALQPRVFDRFFRANQKGVEHITGTGLGLSLVKAIVENHHGQVWLESQPGKGTTFFVAVPLLEGAVR